MLDTDPADFVDPERIFMDDFDEILEELDALDCSLLEEIESEEGKPVNQGCLGIVIICVGIIYAMTFGITKLIII